MSFLAPMFLLGGLAIALPVVFHLIRRTTRVRTMFSSLMFLAPTPPRVTRRSRLEHLLLLALRCAALCLLALGFSRPLINRAVSDPPGPEAVNRFVVLVDTSASMRRSDLWTQARDQAQAVLRKAGPGDEAAVFLFDRRVTPVVSFEEWAAAAPGERLALVQSKLAAVGPGWSGTHLGRAIIVAAEALADTSGKAAVGHRQIVLISDLQEGSHLDQLQGYEWPKGIELTLETVRPRHPGNAGLQKLAESAENDLKAGGSVRLRVNNSSDSRREQFKVGWARPDGRGFAVRAVEVHVPAGQNRVISLESTGSLAIAASSNPAFRTILLQGDEEEFDNSVFVIPPETAHFQVAYFGGDSDQDPHQPLFFLRRAFQETRQQAVQVVARQPNAPVAATDLQAAALVVAVGSLANGVARVLHEEVAGGKTLVFVLQNAADAATLATLLALERLEASEVRPANYAMLAEIDFRHPVFAPFADARYSDFTRIHFWKYRRLDAAALPGAHVLARFDSGDPAMLEVPVGRGRVVVIASGWQPEDSQFALSTKFVPFVYGLIEHNGLAEPATGQYLVGDSVPLATQGGSPTAFAVTAPDGSRLNVAAGQTNFSQTMTPGIYTVAAGQSGVSSVFAVNLDPAESRTAPMAGEELERLGAPVTTRMSQPAAETSRKIRLQKTELEARQKLWRWLVVATLAVLLVETWLAARTGRQLMEAV